VVGVEYEGNAGPLTALLSGKSYLQTASDQLPLPSGTTLRLQRDTFSQGAGAGARLDLGGGLLVKTWYERASRLPTGDERFGDGGLVVENLRLEPEQSHNLGIGMVADEVGSPLGTWRGRLSGLARRASNMVVLLGDGSQYRYENVLDARVLAVDAGLGWASPGDQLGLTASFALEDARNATASGPGSLFRGDRLPNLPHLQAGGGAYLRKRGLRAALDFVELTWDVRHVRRFFLGWESAGDAGTKLEVPAQTLHGLGLAYILPERGSTLSATFEVHNLTDARAYDLFGVQRPGRSFHLKLTITRDRDPPP
jgi:vitamin B12 transporter